MNRIWLYLAKLAIMLLLFLFGILIGWFSDEIETTYYETRFQIPLYRHICPLGWDHNTNRFKVDCSGAY